MNPDHIVEWLLAFALTLVAAAVAVAVARWFWQAARQFRRMVDEEAPRAVGDDALAMLGGPLPGPGRPQASGVSRHEETGIGEWTDAELAFLHGHRETPDE